MFEYQLEGEILHEFNRHGARFPSYNTIVGGGENGCILHYTENESELRDGDLVLIDAGCEYRGYAGDITRTFPVNGKFTQPQREIYDIVLESLETALKLYRPGTSICQVNQEVVRIMITGLVRLGILKGEIDELIANNAHRPYFMHGLSHWLGLDVHDVGNYDTDRSRVLEPGMVLTVEPGLYIATDADVPAQYRGIGIRIEDDIVITEDGNENLTAGVVKKADEIEALMAAAPVMSVLIVGGGMTGATLALAISRLTGGALPVHLIEAQDPHSSRHPFDDRAIAPGCGHLPAAGAYRYLATPRRTRDAHPASTRQRPRSCRVCESGGRGLWPVGAGPVVELHDVGQRLFGLLREAAGVTLHCPAKVEAVSRSQRGQPYA